MQDISKFRTWLNGAYDHLDATFKPIERVSEWHYGEAARVVAKASDWARRLGAPELIHEVRTFPDGGGCCGRDEAKDAIARMLTWCRDYEKEQIKSLTYLTVAQAAMYLQCSEDYIYRRCRSGELPSQKIGRDYRIKRTDLDQLSVEDDW